MTSKIRYGVDAWLEAPDKDPEYWAVLNNLQLKRKLNTVEDEYWKDPEYWAVLKHFIEPLPSAEADRVIIGRKADHEEEEEEEEETEAA
jgi:hypothetical protein